MAVCNKCGASIGWRSLKNGKKLPFDTNEVPFIPDDRAKQLALSPDGLIKGRSCSESNEDERWIYARLPHQCKEIG